MMTPLMTLAAMAAVALITVVLLCLPWWRQRPAEEAERRALNVATYRQRLDEIDQELAGGILDPETAEQLRAEQGARLLADTDSGAAPAVARAGRSRPLWLWMLLVPVAAAVGYSQQGRWGLASDIEIALVDPETGARLAMARSQVELQARLQQTPDDAEAWATLAQLQMASGAPATAAASWARATALVPDQPDWWVAEAEAMAAERQQDLRGPPRERIERALALAPDHGKALFYGGMAAAQSGDIEIARARWSRLLEAHELPPQVRQVVVRGVQEWGGAAAPADVAVTVEITLDPALGEVLGERTVLWVFAKAVDGPPMPLAVRRMQPEAFPVTVTLGDADAMTPELRLSRFTEVELTARLGTGEDVTAQAGDPEGRLRLQLPVTTPQRLVLDSRVGGGPQTTP